MKTIVQLVALVALSGCIIGTWPTPEADHEDQSVAQPTAEDSCDGTDNDADGVIDEGCACTSGSERGCIGVVAGDCGLGVQHCRAGVWDRCESMGPPYSSPRQPEVAIVGVDPPALVRGGTETLTVTATAVAGCAAIQVARVEVTLSSSSPVVRVVSVARDDGGEPDATAGDGAYTAALVNAFGPGVPAQSLRLRVAARIGDSEVADLVTVELEEP